jgi:hypothetical protein
MIQEEMSRIMRAEEEQVNAEVGEPSKKVRDKSFIEFILSGVFFNNFGLEVETKFRKILFLLFAAKR